MRKLTEQEKTLKNKIKDVHDELNKLYPKIKEAADELESYCSSKKRCSECAFQLDDCGSIDVIRHHIAYALKDTREVIE